MSEEKISNTNYSIIYVPLLNEGTDVMRPVKAEAINLDVYRLLVDPEDDSENEDWLFPPGSIVHCEPEHRSGECILIAKKLVK